MEERESENDAASDDEEAAVVVGLVVEEFGVGNVVDNSTPRFQPPSQAESR